MFSENKTFVNISYYFIIVVSIIWYTFFAIGIIYSGFKYEIPMFKNIGISMIAAAIIHPLLIQFLNKKFPDKN